jgi:hypothetical protein
MTNKAEPSLRSSSPRPFTPSAKIVGYITDLKKLHATIAQAPGVPVQNIATPASATLLAAKINSNRAAGKWRISAVPAKRPTMKLISEAVRKLAASFAGVPCAVNSRSVRRWRVCCARLGIFRRR